MHQTPLLLLARSQMRNTKKLMTRVIYLIVTAAGSRDGNLKKKIPLIFYYGSYVER